MKKPSVLILIFAILLMLVGCSSKTEQSISVQTNAVETGTAVNSTDPKAKVDLTVWWWGEQEAPGAQKWMDETVKKFQEQNPNITVKTVLQSTDQLIPAFKSAAAAKQGPDIQYFWGGLNTLQDGWQGNIVPVDDYIPKEELQHYVHNNEREYDGKTWGVSWYLSDNALPYRKDVLQASGLDPENPPKTWDEFLAACEKIKKAGYIPIAAGLKDGWLSGWMWQLLGKQNLDNAKDMIQAVSEKTDWSQPKYSEWLDKLVELKNKGYFNNDILSLDYQQGQDLFLQGKAAFIFGNDTFLPSWVKQTGADKIGVTGVPIYGKGKMADTITVTAQGLGITSWSKHKQEAANFLMFMHTPERLNAWYQETGVFPDDNRFDKSQITLPQMKTMYDLVQSKPSVNLENFIPGILEEQAIFPDVQLLLSGKKKPIEVVKTIEDVLSRWRNENPDDADNFKNWMK